jgi:diguanylate cyclase (GGDEF)-like protein
VTLFAAGITGIAVLLTGFATIAFYANQNLSLIANTTSYAVAPAVVFDDRSAVAASTAPIGRFDGVGGIIVSDATGQTIDTWRRPPNHDWLGIEKAMTRLLFGTPAVSPIIHHGQRIGTVTVFGEAGPVMAYIGSGLAAALACLVITAIAAHFLAGRLMQSVVRPLTAIEHVAHAVREQRAFDRRVPAARIAELDALGNDFNALLSELESWHHGMRRENADLSRQALHDPLTGLANRAHFERALETTLDAARRRSLPFAMIYLDGDGFKRINDEHGHAAGDAALKEIAARLDGGTRPDDLVARLGGDEFAILLPPGSDARTVEQVEQRLEQALAEPLTLPSGETIVVALSAGAAIFPRDGDDLRALVHHADDRMYARKRARKPADRSNIAP